MIFRKIGGFLGIKKASVSEATSGGVSENEMEGKLLALKSMYEKNLISKEEYESKRRELLGSL